MHRKKISISYVLAGQRVGLEEVDDGIWIVSFMHYVSATSIWSRTVTDVSGPYILIAGSG